MHGPDANTRSACHAIMCRFEYMITHSQVPCAMAYPGWEGGVQTPPMKPQIWYSCERTVVLISPLSSLVNPTLPWKENIWLDLILNLRLTSFWLCIAWMFQKAPSVAMQWPTYSAIALEAAAATAHYVRRAVLGLIFLGGGGQSQLIDMMHMGTAHIGRRSRLTAIWTLPPKLVPGYTTAVTVQHGRN